MFVALEGIDCVGKSTQIKLLKKSFKEALFVYEPGFTRLGAFLRELILSHELRPCKKALLFLFLADRAQLAKHLKKYENKLVISDRSFISGLAYAKEYELDFLLALNDFALDGVKYEKIIFLKASFSLIKERLKGKKKDKIESLGADYLFSIQERFEYILNTLKEKKLIDFISVDASLEAQKINEIIKDYINDTKLKGD